LKSENHKRPKAPALIRAGAFLSDFTLTDVGEIKGEEVEFGCFFSAVSLVFHKTRLKALLVTGESYDV